MTEHAFWCKFDQNFEYLIGLESNKKNEKKCYFAIFIKKKGKRKDQGVPQSQAAALPRHQEEEETDKTKQAQIEQTYEKL